MRLNAGGRWRERLETNSKIVGGDCDSDTRLNADQVESGAGGDKEGGLKLSMVDWIAR